MKDKMENGYNRIKRLINNVNWSYYWDEIYDRKFYIFGFFLMITITTIHTWPIIGPAMRTAQGHNIIPPQTRLINIMIIALIFALFTVSWDLLAGYSGQVSFGHALFFGLGAYLTAFIKKGLTIDGNEIFPGMPKENILVNGMNIDISVFKAILLASLIVAVFGLVIGLLTLRMKGPYFALLTLVLPLIAINLFSNTWDDFTGGDGGVSVYENALITDPPNPTSDAGVLNILKKEQLFYVVLITSLICILIVYLIARSRYGMMLRSIREDELAASSSGVNVNRYKLSAIGISAFFASISGGLYLQWIKVASPNAMFETNLSFFIIIFAIIGGIGTIIGGVVATFALQFAYLYYIPDGFVNIPTIDVLILGLLLIIILVFQSRGLINADVQLRNAIFFSLIFTILTAMYDMGELLAGLSSSYNPGTLLMNVFGDNERGFLTIDVMVIQGRMLVYFVFWMIIGYWGPELFRKLRLKIWGVWPNLGSFDPPE